jgi:flavorubredoxin
MFPLVSSAVARIIPLERLRWLFGHFEADECGSMNEWLAAAPSAELMHGMVGLSGFRKRHGGSTATGSGDCYLRERD